MHTLKNENKDKKLTDEEHWFDLYLQFALVFVYYSLTTKRLIVAIQEKRNACPSYPHSIINIWQPIDLGVYHSVYS